MTFNEHDERAAREWLNNYRNHIEEAAGRLHYRIVKLVEAADADQ